MSLAGDLYTSLFRNLEVNITEVMADPDKYSSWWHEYTLSYRFLGGMVFNQTILIDGSQPVMIETFQLDQYSYVSTLVGFNENFHLTIYLSVIMPSVSFSQHNRYDTNVQCNFIRLHTFANPSQKVLVVLVVCVQHV